MGIIASYRHGVSAIGGITCGRGLFMGNGITMYPLGCYGAMYRCVGGKRVCKIIMGAVTPVC